MIEIGSMAGNTESNPRRGDRGKQDPNLEKEVKNAKESLDPVQPGWEPPLPPRNAEI